MGVKEGLLALLETGPRHGYQLKTSFEEVTGGAWRLNVGQVYTTLDRLERDGLVDAVEPSVEAAKRAFVLTDDGRAALGAWWEASGTDDPPPRDELVLKVLFAVEQGTDHALRVVTYQRTALLGLLQRRRREGRVGDDDSTLAARLVGDALVVRAEADLRWLDLCEARLLDQLAEGGDR
jgi:DNA-binding PadR family transcriptional regulator